MKVLRALLILALAFSAWAADVNGKWKATVEGPDGQMELVFDFKAQDGKLTGTVTGPMGDMPISDGKVEGDAISFTVARDEFKILHKGKVAGDEMKLNVEMGERTFEMTAKRVTS